ncbi:hypothetical protein AB0K87_14420 [Streptomyces sp. NPDC053705]|uniref:DUF6907 domain-containing protein n=1 Tax=Streptomyces sp. NPDC053705 TaxID=3156668 RepID=UPI00343FDC40
MRSYTGPTVAGGVSTIECPSWCVTDHAYWDDQADDCFHQSAPLEVAVPRDRVRSGTRPLPGVLETTLRLHSTDPAPSAALVWLEMNERTDDSVELDLAGVDKLLSSLDSYRAGLLELRGLLAGIDAARRT